MIIVNIKDGLGNQMFQYATGYVLAKKINTSVICDTRYLIEKKKNPPKDYVIREFDLDIFGIKAPRIETFKLLPTFQFFKNYVVRHNVTKLLDKFNQNVLMERSRKIDLRIIKNKRKNLYIDGYWQSEEYFKEYRNDIIKLFNFDDLIHKKNNIIFKNEINFEYDVCLNVRRTDHLKSKELNAVTINYYINSINYFKKILNKSFKIYVFSDDLEWCRKNFNKNDNCIFVEHVLAGEKFKNYLYLMSCFKNFIIPNSSFAWWAAWLSKFDNKIIIAPKNWSGLIKESEIDTVPKNWVRIDN